MNSDDKVAKLAEEWAKRFEGNVLEGISQLNETYKDDQMMSKALLAIIALEYPQYGEAILSYLKVHFYIIEEEKGLSKDDVPFNLLKEVVYSGLTTISYLLQLGEEKQAKQRIEEMIDHLSDFTHNMEITAPGTEAEAIQELSENIHKSIKASEKHLDRLGDFIIVGNQDKILKEMIALKKTLAVFEERVQEFIVTKF